MNNIILTGRLTKEPEIKVTSSGVEYMQFSIAVNRAYSKQGEEKQPDFIPCKAWQKTAVFINQYFHKGDGIVLQGRLESNKYVDQNGNNRTFYEVMVDKVEFPQGKAQHNDTTLNYQPQNGTATQYIAPANTTADIPVDEDLPF